ncbi:hypothetical protein EVAR_11061_1 [Eumeta japonica]|uniref:115 kDa protein in type-1 retrotransposable element R1DM n=1 Tax=Eumeta variegata TaxID=151549 RepID=A0A4C1U467_EUMVA|nr:hypothetical protein EVAR_11061_1 [Eumeta japonica]
MSIYKGIARAAKATWGLSPEIVRTIYVAAIEPIVTYASCAWAPATKKLGVRKMLDALQRSVALKACRAYRTVLHSALILARLLPRHTVDRLAIVGPYIYTDGSKTEGKVGAALTEWRDEMESGTPCSGSNPSARYSRQMFALHRAIKRVKEGKDRLVNIFSDSKSSLQMLTAPKPTTLWPMQRQDIRDIVGRQEVRLFWVQRERADELARNAALKRNAADYDRYPLSYAKR